jgi:trimeric autotransporter adhesin
MATISELAQISHNVYDGTSSTTQNTSAGSPLLAGLSGNWEILANSNSGNSGFWAQGYFGVAYFNTVTHEVVIANRGTDLNDGPNVISQNLQSDADLTARKETPVQDDAAIFADQVVQLLGTGSLSFTSLIETGHSLGGTEAQAAVASLVDDPPVSISPSQVSAVLFNSPGIGGFPFHSAASTYNVVDLYDQGDAIHVAGGVHLGGTGNMVMLAAGPDTSSLVATAPLAVAAGPLALIGLLGTALYDVLGPAHSINTIIPYLAPGGGGSTIGSLNWTSSSSAASVHGSPVNPSLPAYLVNSSGDLVVTDPASNISATFALSSNGQKLVGSFSGGTSAIAQALSALGVISVPISEARENLSNITNASVVSESIIRSDANDFDVTFANGDQQNPASGDQFGISTTNSTNAFYYAIPASTQTIVEYIDNGVGNSTGSVFLLGTTTTTQLTGGNAVVGQSDTWNDSTGDIYSFDSDSPDSSTGVLTVSHGLLGTGGNQIVINNFNLASAAGPFGYLGIVLPQTISLNASANAGASAPTPNFSGGASQAYTLSINAPSTAAQTFTVTLSGASPSDFEVAVGNTVEQIAANGTFAVNLAAGETNVSFGFIDTTADNGSSDIASGATLALSASIANPDTVVGGNIQATPITFSYVPEAPDNAPAPKPSNIIVGVLSGGNTVYAGDGADDFMTGTGTSDLFNAQNTGNDSIVGGTGTNTINGGNGNSVIVLNGTSNTVMLGSGYNTVTGSTGNDIIGGGSGDENIVGNGGADLIVLGNGNSQIYAGAQTSLATAIAAASGGTASGVKGDLIALGDGSNTAIGGNGNDLINVGAGNDVIVMGPGNDTFLGGTEVTQAVVGWTATVATGSDVFTLTENGVTAYTENFSNKNPQPNNSPGVGPANDTIYGGKGNEFLELGDGNNYVDSGNGNDTVLGGMGNDTIDLGSGTDTVIGGGGTTYIAGGSGHDFIQGGDGNNTVIGGSGNSTILAAAGPGGTTNFTGANLEQNYVYGGSGNDVIQGSAGNDTLIAGTGNTTVTGVSGNENITGGTGNDELFGGTGNNTIAAGGAGRDSLFAIGSSSSTSILYGGTGTDLISGGSGVNTLYAGDGGVAGAPTTVFASQTDATATTTIYGGLGEDFLEGGAGSAVIYGGDGGTSTAPTSILAGSGATTVNGGLGRDIIEGGSGTDVLYAGDGGTSSAPTTVQSGTGTDTLYGGAGSSVLQDLTSGQDMLVSGSADDTLVGTGSDTLVAGSGNDLLQTSGGSTSFEFNAGFGNDTIQANGGTENLLLGTGILATDFTGSVNFDGLGNSYLTLSGDGGSITLENALTGALASANADASSISLPTLLTDVFGGDTTISPPGVQDFILNLGNDEIVRGVTTHDDQISSWGNGDTIIASSSRVFSAGNSTLINAPTAGIVDATGNSDTFIGGIGGDRVSIGGAGSLVDVASVADANGNIASFVTLSGANDTAVASIGTDDPTIVVNDASDVIQVAATAGTTIVQASVSYTAPTNVASLTLIGTSNISATGNTANDVLVAGAGADTLVSGSGADTLIGGTGNTTFVVNSTSDVVQEISTTNNVIRSSVSYSLIANVNSLTLTGTAALTGTANSANDTLTSNTGIDTLVGGIGSDTFILNNPLDVVQDTLGTATIIYSSAAASFTLPASSNTLTLTGTAAIHATGNTGSDVITANSGADTLTAGNGADTLISGLGATAQSLVGGTGNDLFIINSTADIVNVGTTHGVDTIESSVSYTAAANIANLTLIGTAAIVGTGNSLANLITANSGADTLVAVGATATLVGGSGNDTFVVNSATDVVKDTSTAATNTLTSTVNYTLPTDVSNLVFSGTAALIGTANAANDTLTSNAGADTLVGSTGNDTFVVTNAGVVVQDSSSTASNAVIASVSYTLPTNVNSLSLSGTAALQGTGNSGNDILTANTGADTLVAGSGSDTLIAGAGTAVDSFVGGTGSDLFMVGHAGDVVTVGATHGADTIQSSLSYTLPTNVNTLALTGSANLAGVAVSGNNSVIGNAGNDTLKAGSGSDTLVAGVGIDTLVGGTSADTFVVNNSADVLVSLSATANTVVSSFSYTLGTNMTSLILQGSANLIGAGNAVVNSIQANSGNDTLVAGSGVSSLVGGLGTDLFIINNTLDVVSEAHPEKSDIDTIQSSVSYTLPNTVDVLLLSGTASLSAHGNSNADEIVGNGGANVLTAGNGNSTLVAGTGLATLIGGSGNNTFVINNVTDVIQETIEGHNNVLMSSVTYTLPATINTLILTGSGNLTATANSGNDSIRGNAGSDVLKAGAGSDTLAAGSGLATLVGGSGADTFIVNNSSDVIQSASASVQNVLYSSATYTLPTNVNMLTLTGAANIEAIGNSASDTLIAGAGQDTLVAGSGVATLIGGSGNDTFVVNNSSDVVQDSVTGTTNTLQSSVSNTLAANVNNLVLTSTAALIGTGNAANDTLTANSGADTLVGGAGNDTFVISSTADVIQDTSTTAVNVAQSSVSYSLVANVNALTLTGTAALKGTANGGADTLSSNSGVDTLVGGASNDTFIVNNSLDVVQDGSASATNIIRASVNFTLPVNVNTLTLTGSAALVATGNAAADLLTANGGNDTLVAGSGVATMIGGAGNDTFLVNATGDVVQDTSTTTSNAIQSSVNYSLVANVNTLALTGTAAVVATANSGNDTLISNTGVDTLVGGSGHDLFIINNAADVIQNPTSLDTIESSVSFTAPTSITNLILIGTSNIGGTGNAGQDVLTAGAGADTLVAGSGSFTATMVGGSGNDTFVVNSGSDVIQDTSTTAANLVLSSSSFYSLPSNVDALTLTGTAALQGTGNADINNVLTANSGNDRLTGTASNNTINGGAGADSLYAGPGDNLINAGNGGTTAQRTYVFGNAPGTNVTTQSTIYGGSGADVLEGGPGGDLIYAGSGTDLLLGGTGADTLVGGTGSDQLENTVSGQTGTTYEFAAGFGQETLGNLGGQGFGSLNDTIGFGTGIEVSALTVTALAAAAGPTLLINDGSGSIVIPDGFNAGTIAALTFADSGAETLKQLLNSDGPGTETITDVNVGEDLLSTGSGKTVIAPDEIGLAWVFGDNDIIDVPYSISSTYVYGNNSTAEGGFVWAGGNGDSIEAFVTATLAGANDTLFAARSSESIGVYQSSDTIRYGAGTHNDSIDAAFSYTLPTAATQLTLDSSVGGLSGLSNTSGGVLIANGTADTLTGGAGADTLIAQGNNDVLVGGTGRETYILQNSTDTIDFGSGAASLTSVQAAFSYTLAAAANSLYITGDAATGVANNANDSVAALGANDVLIAGSGNDTLSDNYQSTTTLIGGAGNDTFIVNNPFDMVIDNSPSASNVMYASFNNTSPVASYTLPTNVNTLVLGGQIAVVGVANYANDSLVAHAGADTLVAGTGNDTLVDGYFGDNTFVFNAGFGQDQITGANHGDIIEFGPGIAESSLSFTAVAGTAGSAPSLVITGAGGAVTVQGGAVAGNISSIDFSGGSDFSVPALLAPSGRATIAGTNGNLIISANNDDVVTGGSGQDTIDAWGNGDTLNAGAGGSVIYAGGVGDFVQGGASSDILETIGTAETLVGGTGTETFMVNASSTVIEASASGHNNVISSVSYTVPNNVSTMTLIGNSPLIAAGNSGNDTITGNSADDTLIAGTGVDTLVGGSQADTFIIDNAADTVVPASGAPNDTIQSMLSNYTLPANVNNLVLGTGDSGTGNASNDNIQVGDGAIATAGSGNDTLISFGASDARLVAGTGNDLLIAEEGGGATFDSLVSGTGVDTLSSSDEADDSLYINNSADVVSAISPSDTLYTSVSYTLASNLPLESGVIIDIDWRLTGTSNLVASDQSFGDVTFHNNAGVDTLIGGFLSNTFTLDGSGIVTEIGGPDVNIFNVNNASDVVIASPGSSNTLDATVSYSLPTNVNYLQLGAPNLLGTANSGNDTLLAGTGSTLVGGAGNDSLVSEDGQSTLIAGAGNDTLVPGFAFGTSYDVLVFNPGFGTDLVDPGSGDANTTGAVIEFGSGIGVSSLVVSASEDPLGTAALKITDGASSVTLDNIVSGDTYQFSLAGSGPITLAQFLSEATVTTSSLAGALGNIILEGSASTSIAGGTGKDTIFAGAAHDTLKGGSGIQDLNALGNFDSIVGGSGGGVYSAYGSNDTLVGGSGADMLIGPLGGNTTYVVGNATDTVMGESTALTDTVDSSISLRLPSSVGTLILTGTSALTGTGSFGASDTLIANSGIDTLIGGGSVDTFVLNNSADVIQESFSSSGNKIVASFGYSLPTNVNQLTLTGTAALTGAANAAADTLTSNAGVDTLVGGSGSDTFVVNNAADVIQDISTTATNVLQTTVSFTLPLNVNRLVLTGSGNLSGTGNSANDSLVAGSGLDTLIAGSGTDTLVAGAGLSTLIGGTGNDLFVVDNAGDIIQDTSTTASNSAQSSVSFSLVTNVNSLTLTGTFALTGTANGATDTLTSNAGLDTLVGGGGNDTFVIGNSGDVVQDTSTTATNTAKSAVSYSLATNVNTLVLSGSSSIVGTANGGNDAITGNSGTDTLKGGAGVDTLTAGTGIDTLIGGAGNTTFVVNNISDVVQDTSTTASNTLRSSVTYVLPTNVNALILTGTAALKGTANAGNDTLTSNTGIDTLVGGAGNETFVISNASDVVQETSTSATNLIQSTVAFTLPTNVNSLTFTGSAALHGTGNAGNDKMTANSGADTLSAGNGTDTLVSGTTGADSLVAGTGNDLFMVNFAGDIVTVGATHGTDTIQSSVSYTNAANVANLILTGTSNLTGTGFTLADKITANSGNDTLAAGTAVATLVGGSGNDIFVVNTASDVIIDTSTTATNLVSSSASYTLPTNVNRLILTGTAALIGTANAANDTLTANTGADTLISGAGTAVDSLVGGTGADLFVVNNVSDIVNVGTTHGVDTIQSSVSYTASANVANLTLIGTGAIAGTGNSLAGTLTANNANDTLTAGSGADTLVGGTGTDLFIVNSASDVVKLATTGTSDTIQSSASYTLPTNVQYLTLSGTSALSGTGNSLTDLIVGNSGNDTLSGGTGIAVLEGGRTAGSDQIKALSNQAALIGGAAASTLTGGAFKDFYAAGKVSDSITTGATANVVSVNKGDGATTLQPTTSATNVLSLGAGIDTESLFFTKTGNNLILTDGVSGDSVTFTNWYVGSADQDYTTLQVVEIASANYNSVGTDGLRNKALEAFNLTALVAAYNAAGSPANWALSTAMPTTQLASTSTADYGGDLAYYFGLNGNLTGVDLSAAQSTLTNASFATATQTIDAFSGISGGNGLHLNITPRIQEPHDQPQSVGGVDEPPASQSVTPRISVEPALPNTLADDIADASSNAILANDDQTTEPGMRTIAPGHGPQVRNVGAPATASIDAPTMSKAQSVAGTVDSDVSTITIVADAVPLLRTAASDSPDLQVGANESTSFHQSITPLRFPQIRSSTAPETASIDTPPMSATTMALPVSIPMAAAGFQSPVVDIKSPSGEAPGAGTESEGGAPVSTNATPLGPEQDLAASTSRVIAPSRFPQLLDGLDVAGASAVPSSQAATPDASRTAAALGFTPVTMAAADAAMNSTAMHQAIRPEISVNPTSIHSGDLVDAINATWLTMHSVLDQMGQMPAGGAEASNDHDGELLSDALAASATLGKLRRLPGETAHSSPRAVERV